MSAISLYLHVHQPERLRNYTIFDTTLDHDYFTAKQWEDEWNNERVFRKVAEKSYYPTNHMLKTLLDTHPDFCLSLSITGTFMEQCEKWDPKLLRTFQELIATGRVEIVAETYFHSLSFFYSRFEFEKQVLMHREKVRQLFGVTPTAFRNTELAYNNELGIWAESAGYRTVLCEGWDPILNGRSPNITYRAPHTERTVLLTKNYQLSDDIAFRFSNRDWKEWPLTVEKYIAWLEADSERPLRNLFMDYETFGEHQWEDTGIFTFMSELVAAWLQAGHRFLTVSNAANMYTPLDVLDVPDTVTWADAERDLSAWTGNSMQQEALRLLYDLENDVLRTSDVVLINDWRHLQASDHVYYMATKWSEDGDVHAYFSPYDSPYDAFMYFLNVYRDIKWRIADHGKVVL